MANGEYGGDLVNREYPPGNWHLPDLARICTYYDETWLAYRTMWLNQRNLALHCGYWDKSTHSHSASLINMNRTLANYIGIHSGQRILDAGCGVGGSAIWLAKTYDVEVVGITPVESQIVRANSYIRAHNVADRVSFEQQEYTRTTFPDASFDVIWAMESVCHAPDKRLFLAEAYRLLRPGGRLGINEYMLTDKPHMAADNRILQSWIAGWAIPNLATANDFLQWLQMVGYEDIQLRDITFNVRPSLRRLYWLSLLFWPITYAFYVSGIRSKIKQNNLHASIQQYRALKRGLWFYGILTATAHH